MYFYIMGLYFQFRYSELFFKSPSKYIDKDLFNELDVSGAQYEILRTTDVNNDPPVSNIGANWEQFYSQLEKEYDLYIQDIGMIIYII